MAEEALKNHQARFSEQVYKGQMEKRADNLAKETKDFDDVRTRYDREKDFIDR